MLTRIAVFLLVALLQAQGPAFEAASVKPADLKVRPARVVNANPRQKIYRTNLESLICDAYNLKPYQIVGPSWLDTETYDIALKAPNDAPLEQMPAMMQALLAERFKLRVHRETKDLAVYTLIVGKKGPKMQKAAEGDPFGMGFGVPLEVKGASMAMFAQILSGYMDRPVLDQTGLAGAYNFDLRVDIHALMAMKSGAPPPESATLPSIFEAVDQIGLKFEPRKAPMEMIVVDAAEKVPTEN